MTREEAWVRFACAAVQSSKPLFLGDRRVYAEDVADKLLEHYDARFGQPSPAIHP